jgi:Gas vesicle protein K
MAALQLHVDRVGLMSAHDSLRRSQRSSGSRLLAGHPDLDLFGNELQRLDQALRRRINADRETLEKGLAQLVLTLIEVLRELLERQALRRIEGGTLSDDEVERLGETFMLLEQRMKELMEAFDLEDEDLNLDLGPLGTLR